MADNMATSAETIQYLIQSVKELKEANELLVKKVKTLEEKNETASSDIRKLKTDVIVLECQIDRGEDENAVSKKEMCEHVEEVISSIYPLQDGWRAVYSPEEECMGYYDSSQVMMPPPDYLFWDRTQWMKKPVITIS
jgi:FtsZ-binding cell division protein ZapB